MTQPTRAVCTPWATSADLPESKPVLDDDTWSDLLWQSSELLYLWSGRQYSGGCTTTVVFDIPPGAQDRATPYWFRWGDPWVDPWMDPWIPRGLRRVRDQKVALLPDPPVTSIVDVTIDGVALVAETDYIAELPAGLVRRVGDTHWPTDGTARITYTHGIAPPLGGQRAAVLLAIELGKSWTGQKCALPKRVETITREGLSIGMATTMNGWRTGIWDIDAWIASVNPHMMSRRASAWSPDAIHARRVRTS